MKCAVECAMNTAIKNNGQQDRTVFLCINFFYIAYCRLITFSYSFLLILYTFNALTEIVGMCDILENSNK